MAAILTAPNENQGGDIEHCSFLMAHVWKESHVEESGHHDRKALTDPKPQFLSPLATFGASF